jgi:Type IV secretion-system coupling protein DNA-binding domain
MQEDKKITYFGIADSRNQERKFGIYDEDRLRHVYAIGKTGMGKSTLLENMAIQDIQNGNGLAFLDPHGKTVELLMEYVPEHRIKDVIYIAPFDLEHPIAFNVLEDVEGDAGGEPDPVRRQLIVSGLMSTFKKLWQDQWSARMEYILNYTLLALLEVPDATLLDVNRMLSDKQFRNNVIKQLKEPTVKMYWEKEFASYTDKTIAEATPAIQNKVGQFISNSLIRNIIGQKKSSFDIRKAMDEKKILLINLSIGRIGEDAVNLLGSLFVTKIYLAAMSRATVPDREMKYLPNFYLYVDEFQNFTNDSFAQILAQARKYKLSLIVAHQYVKQMTEVVRDAIFGNVGTMVAFRVGADDGESLEKEFQPTFVVEDFVNIGRFQMYLKLMINGVTSQAFSAKGLAPWAQPTQSFVQEIIDSSRKIYAHPRKDVESHILEWTLGGGNNAQGSNSNNANVSQSGQNNRQQQSQQSPRDIAPRVQNNTRPPAQQSGYSAPRSQSSQAQQRPARTVPADSSTLRNNAYAGQQQVPPRARTERQATSSPRTHNPFAAALKDALQAAVAPEKAEVKVEKLEEIKEKEIFTPVIDKVVDTSVKQEVDPMELKKMLGME